MLYFVAGPRLLIVSLESVAGPLTVCVGHVPHTGHADRRREWWERFCAKFQPMSQPCSCFMDANTCIPLMNNPYIGDLGSDTPTYDSASLIHMCELYSLCCIPSHNIYRSHMCVSYTFRNSVTCPKGVWIDYVFIISHFRVEPLSCTNMLCFDMMCSPVLCCVFVRYLSGLRHLRSAHDPCPPPCAGAQC